MKYLILAATALTLGATAAAAGDRDRDHDRGHDRDRERHARCDIKREQLQRIERRATADRIITWRERREIREARRDVERACDYRR